MKPGNLVEITRASIGIPAGTLALIVKSDLPERFVGDSAAAHMAIHTVQLIGNNKGISIRRFLERDMKEIS